MLTKFRLILVWFCTSWVIAYFVVHTVNPEKAVFSATFTGLLVGLAIAISNSQDSEDWFPDFNWIRLLIIILLLLLTGQSAGENWRSEIWSIPPIFGLALLAESIAVRFR